MTSTPIMENVRDILFNMQKGTLGHLISSIESIMKLLDEVINDTKPMDVLEEQMARVNSQIKDLEVSIVELQLKLETIQKELDEKREPKDQNENKPKDSEFIQSLAEIISNHLKDTETQFEYETWE